MGRVQCQPGNCAARDLRRLQLPLLFELTIIGNLLGRHGVIALIAQVGLHIGIHHAGTHSQSGHFIFFSSQNTGEMIYCRTVLNPSRSSTSATFVLPIAAFMYSITRAASISSRDMPDQ